MQFDTKCLIIAPFLQNEIENLKQALADSEEKVQYQSDERLRDVHEVLENCQTRVRISFIFFIRMKLFLLTSLFLPFLDHQNGTFVTTAICYC